MVTGKSQTGKWLALYMVSEYREAYAEVFSTEEAAKASLESEAQDADGYGSDNNRYFVFNLGTPGCKEFKTNKPVRIVLEEVK